MTSLVRDIQLVYPGQFEIDVDTTVKPIWENNPHITRLWNHDSKNPRIEKPGAKFIKCQYGTGIREQNSETIHFAAYFHRDFKKQTGIDVPCQLPYGDIHLTEEEKNTPPVEGRYWLILTGGKSDFTIKVWHNKYFQEVVDRLGDMGVGVVQTGANHGGHWHPEITGDHVISLVGWGGFRQFIQQIYHAEGVICGVTAAMHIAAALHKPCVVIAGGREAWWWEAYVNENRGFGPVASGNVPVPHQFLHTIGLLDCCKHHGCWKNKVVQLGKDKMLCKRPIQTPEMPIAECMQMITPDHVMEAVMRNYTDGTLPPIQLTSSTQMVPGVPLKQPAQQGACKVPQQPNKMKKKVSGSITIPAGAKLKINPRAKINMKDQHGKRVGAPQAQRPGTGQDFGDDSVLDHKDVGGKFTVFMLFYGGEEYFELHKKCLSSFLATVPAKRADLRVGSNQLNKKSRQMLDTHVERGFITKHYCHEGNDYKYPVMKEMFNDPTCPIETKWVLWFDDDSICDVEPAWLNILGIHISQHHKDNVHMIGAKYVWTTNKKQREIIEARPWFSGRPWQQANGQPSPNGSKIIFTAGGFFAITAQAIRKAGIPDLGTGLTHTGGDWQVGAQVYQAGFNMKQFNGKKQFVRTSSVDRRGVTMPTIDHAAGPTPDVTPAMPTVAPTPPPENGRPNMISVPPLVHVPQQLTVTQQPKQPNLGPPKLRVIDL